ncbi:dihydroneopterin aldolase [Candidatus Chlamydia sanziniae]|uniref:7,8-dihydroneopterin aldolase n=1 Tax=Candidatus Chlamydia sanziniae TaxID=1806891 RepID=A0A1A9HU88_9CHLA|nr:dihydroneopterin aldolase [Candidatus Chlamydia sanziniae]ANH78560.1 Dihydroneopterin aldolase [Candidatus Chlamydia sanziniae]
MAFIEQYQLIISDFRVWLYLGCSPEERHFKQPVLVSVTLSFYKEPVACVSDNLADACCYIKLTSLIEEIASAKPYALVEHLAKSLLDGLDVSFGDRASEISLEVAKERPPVPNLLKPIRFKMSKEVRCPSLPLSV